MGTSEASVKEVTCATTGGPLTIEVHEEWAPLGAQRFLAMVRDGYFSTKVGLFRCVKGFLCQTGIAGDPAVFKQWDEKGQINDDPQWLSESDDRGMKRGYLSFAGGGTNSRGLEFFFTFRDVGLGVSPWEVPFGKVVGEESFQVMDRWYTGYGDMPDFGGKAPEQDHIYKEGLKYLEPKFPDLDYITSCDVVGE